MSDIDAATFEAFKSLLTLIIDAPACKARVLELRKLQDKLEAAREAFNKHSDQRSAELDAREKELTERRTDIEQAAVKHLREQYELVGIPHLRSDPRFVQGSGMSQEPYTEPVPEDAHFPKAAGERIFRPNQRAAS